MRFKQHTQHKTRPKLLTVMLALFLSLGMLIPMISETLHVQALEGIGDGSGYDPDVGSAKGDLGSRSKTGYLVYVSDSSGNLCSHVAFVASGSELDRTKYYDGLLVSRIGGQVATTWGSHAKWGPPFDEHQQGLGKKIKDEMLQDTYDGVHSNAAWVISRYVPEAYELFINDPENHYLVLEACAWHQVWGGPAKGEKIAASQTGWAQLGVKCGIDLWPRTNWVENCALAVGMYMDSTWPGLPAPVTKLGVVDNSTILTAGYGMIVVRGNETSMDQTTCDEPEQPDPHKPPEESTGTFKIVKSYRIRNLDTGVLTDSGTFVKPDSSPKITIEDESEYKLIAWKTSTTYKPDIVSTKWESTVPAVQKQSGTSPTTIEMKTPETTLYLLLEKPESEATPAGRADFIMSQSTITRKIKISKPDNNGITIMKDVGFKWHSPAHKSTCSGHSYTTHHSDGHTSTSTAYCSYGRWTDNTVNFSLKNSEKSNYPDIVATKAGWENVTTTGLSDYVKRYKSSTRSVVGSSTLTVNNWDYSCVLLRGKDKLTVANWKNTDLSTADANTDLSGVSSSGFSIGNSASGNRKKALYYDSFVAQFDDDSPDLSTEYCTTSGDGHGHNCGKNKRSYSLQNPLTINAGVKVETYSGSDSGGTIDSSCDSSPTSYSPFSNISVLANKNMVRGIEVPSGANLSFRPYIQMNYDVQTATHEAYGSSTTNHKTAYVLGDIQRGMAPNDYAEISWKSRDSDKPNLTLNSLQWSTHASAVDFISNKLGADNLQKFTVLPGGATLDLTIKDADRQTVMATTYQCIVDGSGKTQIDNAGGSYAGLTTADAESSHQAYVSSVIEGLEKLNVEQWVTKDISGVNSGNIESSTTDVWNISGGTLVDTDIDLTPIGHSGQKASNEEKYYFRADGTMPDAPASEGDLDVEEKGTTTKKYTFFTNTYGEVRYTVDDVNPNTGGNERKGNLANDSIANQINQRTHVVDKLAAAVEQGTGNDPSGRSKTGTTWYNEAFDGITVYVQTTELSVGYIEPPQRSTVLDVKLTQTQDNQSDMFNEEKYNMSQYRTRPYSDAYIINDVAGTFKGEYVEMKEMSQLFFSRKFFIGNVTVDDLH